MMTGDTASSESQTSGNEVEREPWPEYRICRECYDTGATVRGNDGWMRHESCARDKNWWPHNVGRESLLGADVSTYIGGDVRVIPDLIHTTSRLTVMGLAARFGERGVDYETLHPSPRFLANGEDLDQNRMKAGGRDGR